ncbi:unnamed protein product [Durusdinium trenchii]
MQALQMDITKLVPVSVAVHQGTKLSAQPWATGRGRVKAKEHEDPASMPLPVLPEVPGALGGMEAKDTNPSASMAEGSEVKATESVNKNFSSGSKPSWGREGKNRRSSIDLSLAVSRAKLTEVFKVREMQLTADLSPRDKGKVDLEESSSQGEVDEAGLHLVARSLWLKLHPVNTLFARHLSKALGLLPLFQEGTDGCCGRWKHWASRLYHWLLISYLLHGIVIGTYELSV